MNTLSICIMLVIYGRMIEVYLTTSIGPIPLATMTNRDWSPTGQNYLKFLFALAFIVIRNYSQLNIISWRSVVHEVSNLYQDDLRGRLLPMKQLLSCKFNMDTACVELKFDDGSMISIDCTAVEDEVAKNMRQRSELDYLIYNDPVGYADLILNGDPEEYLKNVTDHTSLD